MEQTILSALMQLVQYNQGTRISQHGFRTDRSYLTKLISFYNKVSHLVNEEKAVDVVYLGFGKMFDTISHMILLEKLVSQGADE